MMPKQTMLQHVAERVGAVVNELSGGATGRRRGMEWRGGPVEVLVIIVVPANRSGGVHDILA